MADKPLTPAQMLNLAGFPAGISPMLAAAIMGESDSVIARRHVATMRQFQRGDAFYYGIWREWSSADPKRRGEILADFKDGTI